MNINIKHPVFIHEILQREFDHLTRQFMLNPSATLDEDVARMNSLRELYEVMEQLVSEQVDPKWQIKVDGQGNPFQSEAMKEYAANRDALRDKLINEYEADADDILSRNQTAVKEELRVRKAMRLTRETFDEVADLFDFDRDELQKDLVAPSASPKYIVEMGRNDWGAYKPREFNKKYSVQRTDDLGILYVIEKK